MRDKLKRGSVDEYGRQIPDGEPSPAEIEAGLAEIRERWTPLERWKRTVTKVEAWGRN